MLKTRTGTAVCLAVLLIAALGCPDSENGDRRLPGGTSVRGVLEQAAEGEGEGESPTSTVMIRKFNDLNMNGFLDAGEPEIGNNVFVNGEGWPIFWADPTGAEFSGATPVWSLEAGTSGVWTFWEGSVPGWTPTGAMVNWEMVQDFESPITIDITAGVGEFYEIIFLNAQTEVEPCNLRIRKFNDINRNGCVDPGEPEIGVAEFIDSTGWPVAYVDPNGAEFTAETPVCINAQVLGTWIVVEGTVDGWVPTGALLDGIPINFSEPIPVDFTGVGNGTHEVIFLNAREQEPGCNLTIRKFNDLNMNGFVDDGEPEIGVTELVNGGGWPVFYSTPNTPQIPAQTPVCVNATTPGVWSVWEDVLEGWFATGALLNGAPVADFESGVSLEFTGACDEAFEVIFLNARVEQPQTGTICAYKVYDDERDGNYDLDAPIEGFRLCLQGCDINGNAIMPMCAYTDASGAVCWEGLQPGCYTVCEVMPDGNWFSTGETCFNVELGANDFQEVYFGNYCVDRIGMHSKGWWHSKHGCAAICRNPELLEALNALAPFASGQIYTKNCKCRDFDCDDCDFDHGDDCDHWGDNDCDDDDDCHNWDDDDCDDDDDDCDEWGDKKGKKPHERNRHHNRKDKFDVITLPFDNCCEVSCFLVASNDQDKRIGLAQQLAAFVLNLEYGDCSRDTYFESLDMTAQQIIDAAVEAWQSGCEVRYWQKVLDCLNNARYILCTSTEPCPIIYCDKF